MTEFTLADHNHNLRYNIFHEFFWGFGAAFHTIYAVIPLFLRTLGAPENIAMSSAGLFSILIALPMLFIAALGRNIRNIKRAVILVHCVILAVSFIMGFTFTYFKLETFSSAWIVYFIYFLLYGLAIGIIVPIWAEFLNKATLQSERGQFFGIGFAFNSLGSFVGGFALRSLLSSSIPFPQNFGVGFFILFGSLSIGTLLFIFYRTKPKPETYSNKTIKDFIRELKQIIWGHKNFQKYLFSRIFYCASLPGMGLYAIYCQDKFNFDISEAGIFTILNVIASGTTSYIVGKIGDKWGHKSSMMVAYISHLLAVLLAIFAQDMIWVYGIFIAIGAGQGAFMPSAMNLVYDFAENRDTKSYMALIDSFLAPFVMIYIIGIGILIGQGAYMIAFYVLGSSLFIGILLLHFLVFDPKHVKQTSIHIDGFSS
jgi:MFS family permease|tara:strand:+ start:2325 stop:3602 length:1278 start_codon:yes stop_codon:yes gene_type:complete